MFPDRSVSGEACALWPSHTAMRLVCRLRTRLRGAGLMGTRGDPQGVVGRIVEAWDRLPALLRGASLLWPFCLWVSSPLDSSWPSRSDTPQPPRGFYLQR